MPEAVLLGNLDATEAFGRRLGELLAPGMVVGLEGPLGAGKTTLVQAICRGLEVPASEYVRSPTFAILNQYRGKSRVYHFDLYRIEDPRDVDHLGWEEYVGADGVALIEWIDRAPALLAGGGLRLRIAFAGAEGARALRATFADERHARLWREAARDLPRTAGAPTESE